MENIDPRHIHLTFPSNLAALPNLNYVHCTYSKMLCTFEKIQNYQNIQHVQQKKKFFKKWGTSKYVVLCILIIYNYSRIYNQNDTLVLIFIGV